MGLEFGRVALLNDQAVVVVQLLTGGNIAQRLDENPFIDLVCLAIGRAGMVDPSRRIATIQGINHTIFIHMEVKRVVGLVGVMGVAGLGFLPADDFAGVFQDDFTLGQVLYGKHAFAMHPRAPGLNSALTHGTGWFEHG